MSDTGDESTTSRWIVETSEATFLSDVIDRSHELPVVVDFWAAWCQPCRLLTPLLEQAAKQHDGEFLLAKANTETLPNIAAQFGVQSIPAVFAVRSGQIVDQFVGVLPEAELETWLQRVLPSEAEKLLAKAQAVAESDPEHAVALLRDALDLEPGSMAAQTELAKMQFQVGRVDEAQELINRLERRGTLDSEIESIRAQISIARRAEESGDVAACQAAVDRSPKDLTLKLKLATALLVAEQHEKAFDLLLEVIRIDRHGVGESAKGMMVEALAAVESNAEMVSQYRRKLSAALF